MIKACLVALAVLVGCRTPIGARQSDEFLERADRVGVALDEAIDRAGDETSEEQRIRELVRLDQLSNLLGRARLVGYMSHVDGDVRKLDQSKADLRKVEVALGLENEP